MLYSLKTCPICGGKAVGRIGVDQYYCWDCLLEFNGKNEVFAIAEDGTLVAYNPQEGLR